MQTAEGKIADICLKREGCIFYGLYQSKDQVLFNLKLIRIAHFH